MSERIEKKADELFEMIIGERTQSRKEAVKRFMAATGEKNEITAMHIVLDSTDWMIKCLRKYLLSQGVKIYCIQMRDKEGGITIDPHFYPTFDEAMKRAEQVKTEEDETTEVMVDLLFRT